MNYKKALHSAFHLGELCQDAYVNDEVIKAILNLIDVLTDEDDSEKAEVPDGD